MEQTVILVAITLLAGIIIVAAIRLAAHRRQRQRAFQEAGRLGEEALMQELICLKGRFRRKKLFRNLYLPGYREGSTTEIDLVMLCRSGIYVFENKNYTGDVMGDEDAREWYQSNVNGNSFYFYNPIAQNRTHISCLMRALRIDNPGLLKSVIVFGSSCNLRRVKTYRDDFVLCKAGKVKKGVKKLSKRSPKALRREDIKYLSDALLPYCNANRRVQKEHIRQVKNR